MSREISIQENVALQFTKSSWSAFFRTLLGGTGERQALSNDPRVALSQVLSQDLWGLQEGNNLLLVTRYFVLPCTLMQKLSEQFLVVHSCRPVTDGDAVNAFRDGIQVKANWVILLPEEESCGSRGSAVLYAHFFPGEAPGPADSPKPAAQMGVSDGIDLPISTPRTNVSPAAIPIPPVPSAAIPAPMEMAAVGAGVKSEPLLSAERNSPAPPVPNSSIADSNNEAAPVPEPSPVSSVDYTSSLSEIVSATREEPLFKLGEEAPKPTNTKAVTSFSTETNPTPESGIVSFKVSGGYTLEGALPQEAVDQLLKKTQGFPPSEPIAPAPAVPPSESRLEPIVSERFAEAVPASGANRVAPWTAATSGVSLSQSTIDAMLDNIRRDEPKAAPVPAIPQPNRVSDASGSISRLPQDPVTPSVGGRMANAFAGIPAPAPNPQPIPQPAQQPAQMAPPAPRAALTAPAADGPMLTQAQIDALIRELAGKQ